MLDWICWGRPSISPNNSFVFSLMNARQLSLIVAASNLSASRKIPITFCSVISSSHKPSTSSTNLRTSYLSPMAQSWTRQDLLSLVKSSLPVYTYFKICSTASLTFSFKFKFKFKSNKHLTQRCLFEDLYRCQFSLFARSTISSRLDTKGKVPISRIWARDGNTWVHRVSHFPLPSHKRTLQGDLGWYAYSQRSQNSWLIKSIDIKNNYMILMAQKVEVSHLKVNSQLEAPRCKKSKCRVCEFVKWREFGRTLPLVVFEGLSTLCRLQIWSHEQERAWRSIFDKCRTRSSIESSGGEIWDACVSSRIDGLHKLIQVSNCGKEMQPSTFLDGLLTSFLRLKRQTKRDFFRSQNSVRIWSIVWTLIQDT